MKIGDLLKAAGSRLLREVPGVDAVFDIIEAATGRKLDKSTATGDDASAALSALPEATQAQVLALELEEVKQSGDTLRAMLVAESSSTQTTRPYIAKSAFHVVAFVTLMVVSIWAYAVVRAMEQMVATIMDGWPWVVSLLVPFIGWLNAYFGILKTEHQNRLDAATGAGTKRPGLGGLLEMLRR